MVSRLLYLFYRMRRLFFAAVVILLTLISCQQEEPTLNIRQGDKMTVAYGEKFYLDLLIDNLTQTDIDAEGGYWNVATWEIMNDSIVKQIGTSIPFGHSAMFYACGLGETNVCAKKNINGELLTATCMITVSEMKMESLCLDTTFCNLKLGEEFQMNATYEPSNTSFPQLKWSSSDDNVATVNYKGLIRAKSIGECVITAFNYNSDLKAECYVTVSPIDMTSLQLSEASCKLELGEQHYLSATYEPTDVTYTDLYWYSSDENVATVSDGYINTVGVGECVVSVMNSDSSLTAQCNVSVYLTEMTSISCLPEKTTEQYESFYLDATYQPTNATIYNDALRWHSSDENVAVVNEKTGLITCLEVGECTITISNIYNSITATCHLTVTPVLVQSLSLNESFLYLPVDDSKRLYCTINPEYAYNKELKWESSDNSVVTVTEDGVVTAISQGTATVKVSALDGSGCSAECTIVSNFESTLEEHVEKYIERNVSRYLSDTSWEYLGNLSFPIPVYTYTIINKGEERLYLKEAHFRALGATSIEKYIEPGETLKVKVAHEGTPQWRFEMYGVKYYTEIEKM